ncbi:MAG: hypothetical protein ACREUE_12510, partial [Panacagrimonas sp.]
MITCDLPADESAQVERILQTAEREKLHETSAWRSLTHVRRRWGLRTQSQADRDAFFLSSAGRDDPAAELRATIRALFGPQDVARDTRCRFPARDRWLRERLALAP